MVVYSVSCKSPNNLLRSPARVKLRLVNANRDSFGSTGDDSARLNISVVSDVGPVTDLRIERSSDGHGSEAVQARPAYPFIVAPWPAASPLAN